MRRLIKTSSDPIPAQNCKQAPTNKNENSKSQSAHYRPLFTNGRKSSKKFRFLCVVDPAVRGAESHSATALPYKLFTTFFFFSFHSLRLLSHSRVSYELPGHLSLSRPTLALRLIIFLSAWSPNRFVLVHFFFFLVFVLVSWLAHGDKRFHAYLLDYSFFMQITDFLLCRLFFFFRLVVKKGFKKR